MHITLRQKKILFICVFFAILLFSSLFFARHFSALSTISEVTPIQEKQAQTIETGAYDENNTNNSAYAVTPPADSTDKKDVSPNTAQRIPIKDEIKKSSPVLAMPASPALQKQKEESPPATPQENEKEIQSQTQIQPTAPEQTEKPPEGNLIVIRIVDGDTLVLSNKKTVRLIGINTPEKDQPYYAEAKNKLAELTMGKPVRLEKDISDTDRYRRLLRYVYAGDLFINLEMVKNGLANSYAYPPDTARQQEFLTAERTARTEGIGFWKKSTSLQEIILTELHADAEGSDAKNLNGEYVVLKNTSNSPISLSRWSVKDAGTHIYTFPDFTLANGATLTLYSGKGTNITNSLYWNSKDPIWNNDSDTLYLRTASGELAIEYAYSTP